MSVVPEKIKGAFQMKKMLKKAAAVILSLAMLFVIPINLPAQQSAHAAVSAVWPVDTQYQNITTYFNELRNVYDVSGYHNAVDIEANYGANIYAAYPGTCISADWMDAYGYMVILYHEDIGVYTFYAHCSSIAVSAGASVAAGSVIAYVGSTGQSSGNHLHFGICNKLLSGWPCATYFDPLTFFTYDGSNLGAVAEDCECSEEYAGIYTTKGVTTYLNIRSGHSSSSAIIGQIPPEAEVTVTKGDGSWAHVQYNGVSGCCSMEYIEKIRDIESGMSISGETAPQDTLELGAAFSVRGIITSNLPISRVWGGVYSSDGETALQTAEASPNALTYNLSGYFDSHIIFNKLDTGTYIYKIEAEDSSGQSYTLVSSVFSVGEGNIIAGDLNGDEAVTISDAVILQNYLICGYSFSAVQFAAADMNSDHSVDAFDMVVMKQRVTEEKSAE